MPSLLSGLGSLSAGPPVGALADRLARTSNGLGMLVPSNPLAPGYSVFQPGLLNPGLVPNAIHWVAVLERFKRFSENVMLTTDQKRDGQTKCASVISRLNRAYYGTNSATDNSFLVGSWSKGTAVRPPRDLDVYFILPFSVYSRFEKYVWNKQSALLQEVKVILNTSFPKTDLRGDGQVVVVDFGSYGIEVVPAFALTTLGHYWICETSSGGRYKETAPWEEAALLENMDFNNARNVRPLIRMLKAWQYHCSVPIKSFHLELLASEFIMQSPWRLNGWFYFDWIIRDLFYFIYHRAHGKIMVPGASETIFLGDAWQSYVASAYQRALKACNLEYENRILEAGEEWQKIFGIAISRTV